MEKELSEWRAQNKSKRKTPGVRICDLCTDFIFRRFIATTVQSDFL